MPRVSSRASFGTSTLVLDVDDSALQAGLVEAEKSVSRAAQSMQKTAEVGGKGFVFARDSLGRFVSVAKMAEQEFGKLEYVAKRSSWAMQSQLAPAFQNVVSKGMMLRLVGSEMALLGGSMGVVGRAAASLTFNLSALGAAFFGWPGVILAAAAGVGFLLDHLRDSARAAEEARKALEEYWRVFEERHGGVSAQAITTGEEATMAAARLRGPIVGRRAELTGARNVERRRLEGVRFRRYAAESELAGLMPSEPQFEIRRAYLEQAVEKYLASERNLESKIKSMIFAHEKEISDLVLRKRAEREQGEERLRQERLQNERKATDQMIALWRKATARHAEIRKEQTASIAAWWKESALGTVVGTMFRSIAEERKRTQMEGILGMLEGFGLGGLVERARKTLGMELIPAAVPAIGMGRGGLNPFEFTGGKPMGGVPGNEQLQHSKTTASNTGQLVKILARLVGFGAI